MREPQGKMQGDEFAARFEEHTNKYDNYVVLK